MDWNQIVRDPIYQGGAAAVLVALVLLLWLWRRRRNSNAAAPAFMTPQDAIQEMAALSPPFGRLMQAFMAENSLAELLEQQEVSAAFDRLQNFLHTRTASSKQDKALHLKFEPPSTRLSSEAKASLLTIARCIFLNEGYVSTLDQKSRSDLDELLDALT